MSSNPLEYSKYRNREVTEFICEELLYDYLLGVIDEERKLAIEKALLESKKLQKQLQMMQQSLELAKSLKEFDVEDGLLSDFREVKSPFEQFLDEIRFRQWPFGVRWSVEVVVVLGLVSFTLYAVPWSKLMRFENFGQNPGYTLAQIERSENQSDSLKIQNVAANENVDPATIFKDEAAKTEDSKIAVKNVGIAKSNENSPSTATTTNSPSSPRGDLKVVDVTKVSKPDIKGAPVPVDVATKNANLNIAGPSTTATINPGQIEPPADAKKDLSSPTTVASGALTGASGAAQMQSGFLFRGSMKITGIEMNGPKMTERILQLGGRKAGEVDLGWRKTPTVLYYHFTIPESKQTELETIFNSYGKMRLAKEKHPRVMPEGISRYIVEVEEGQ